MEIKRIYHPYDLWEDFKNGMWTKEGSEELLPLAIEFTGNTEQFGEAMLKVVSEWPFASEHNLTNMAMNRKAWMGQAAASYAHNIPEHITRAAWMQLTKEQRKLANDKAKIAIETWEKSYLGKTS